jgi:dihydroneopterin aldolase
VSDLIRIVGVKAKGFHGVLEIEQKRGQKFIVDVELRLTLSRLNDDLSKTVNYAQVAMVINDQITGKPQKLIESLAENIAIKILKDFKKVKSVKVTVHKPKAPIKLNFKDIQVEIERSR